VKLTLKPPAPLGVFAGGEPVLMRPNGRYWNWRDGWLDPFDMTHFWDVLDQIVWRLDDDHAAYERTAAS
jgi:hypothetical protein